MFSLYLHLDLLESFAQDIYSSVDIQTILPWLTKHGLVTRFDLEYFTSSSHTSVEKQRKLMCLAISLNEKCVEKFLECLSQTVGEYAPHGELLEKICNSTFSLAKCSCYNNCDRLCKNRPCSHLVVIRETAV